MTIALPNNNKMIPGGEAASSSGFTIPKFGCAGTATNNNNSKEDVGWLSSLQQVDANSAEQDYDLLAEYLLDDGSLNALPGFGSSGYYDVSSELYEAETNAGSAPEIQEPNTANGPGYVSTFADPLADAAELLQQTNAFPAAPAPTAAVTAPPTGMPKSQPIPQPKPVTGAPLPHPGMPTASPMMTKPTPTPTTAPTYRNPPIIVHQHMPQAQQPQQLSGMKRPLEMNHFHPGGGQSARPKSQAQIEKRRERNRILARRTRLRKKFFFESLQKEVMDLQRENSVLKDIVKTKIEDADARNQILKDCNAASLLPSVVTESCGEKEDLEKMDFQFVCSVKKSQQCFLITDPSLHDNPIVYASDDFFRLTGYTREEVLGRNCRFLQGVDTSPNKVETMRKAIASGEDCSVCILNYTAQGKAFWNQLFIAALRDTQNNVVNYIGVLVKVDSPPPDDPEAGKVVRDDDTCTDPAPVVSSAAVVRDDARHGEVDELLGVASAAVSKAAVMPAAIVPADVMSSTMPPTHT